MTTTDRQVKIIMNELSKHGNQERAAAKAGVCRQTAAKYIQAGKLSSELKALHGEDQGHEVFFPPQPPPSQSSAWPWSGYMTGRRAGNRYQSGRL